MPKEKRQSSKTRLKEREQDDSLEDIGKTVVRSKSKSKDGAPSTTERLQPILSPPGGISKATAADAHGMELHGAGYFTSAVDSQRVQRQGTSQMVSPSSNVGKPEASSTPVRTGSPRRSPSVSCTGRTTPANVSSHSLTREDDTNTSRQPSTIREDIGPVHEKYAFDFSKTAISEKDLELSLEAARTRMQYLFNFDLGNVDKDNRNIWEQLQSDPANEQVKPMETSTPKEPNIPK